MQEEIIKLLKKEGKISDETISEISKMDINDFSGIVEDIGKSKTQHLDADKISKNLNTKVIGQNIYIFNEVRSTNTVARFLSLNGAEQGTVVISEKQTGAKGRSGKAWASPLGGIWLSIILNPNVDHSKLPMITLATGVAVAKALERIGVENPEIKWPNDIMINGKKVSGVLTEAIASFNTIENVIVGIGIDGNMNIEDFPEELQEGTTTLKEELGSKIDEHELIEILLEEFEKISILFWEEKFEEILKEWRKRSYSIGKIVEVREPFKNYYDAYVLGIGKEGALVVEKIDGTLQKVISGECIIKN